MVGLGAVFSPVLSSFSIAPPTENKPGLPVRESARNSNKAYSIYELLHFSQVFSALECPTRKRLSVLKRLSAKVSGNRRREVVRL